MSSLTLKDVPPDLLERLKSRAKSERRSLNQEAIVLLTEMLRHDAARTADRMDSVGPNPRAWKRLVGQWVGDDTDALATEIYRRRTKGRKVSF